MEWLKDQNTSDIDNYISSSIYTGMVTQGEGIDLRQEMHSLLYGGTGKTPKGHWICFRKYDRSKPSSSYNKTTKEGVNGPAFEYKDYMIRSRRVTAGGKTEQTIPLQPGVTLGDQFIYYFEWNMKPQIGDDIYELDWDDHSIIPVYDTSIFTERYKIKRVLPYRLENGNIQFYSVISDFDDTEY